MGVRGLAPGLVINYIAPDNLVSIRCVMDDLGEELLGWGAVAASGQVVRR